MESNRIITLLIDQNSAHGTLEKAAEDCASLRIAQKPLAEQSIGRSAGPSLLAVDRAGSLLCFKNTKREGKSGYSAYGCGPLYRAPLALGFNGEFLERRSNRYGLGLGYREYDTRLMRFLSPDRISPFGAGGLNAYSYCAGDPVNYHDPSGHKRDWISFLLYKKKLASMRGHVKFNAKTLMVETEKLERRLTSFEKEETSKNLQKMRSNFFRFEKVRGSLDYFRGQEQLYQYKKMKSRYPEMGEEGIQQKLVDKRSVHQETLGLERRALDIRGRVIRAVAQGNLAQKQT